MMPAPAWCEAPKKIRGKRRPRTMALTVGAGQRLGPILIKFSDAAARIAVEGTVAGQVGQKHFALALAIGATGACRRAPWVGACLQRSRAPPPKGPCSSSWWRTTVATVVGQATSAITILGACCRSLQNSCWACRLQLGSLSRPRSILVPRVQGYAQVDTLDFVKAQARAASGSGAAPTADHASALREYDAGLKALSAGQQCGSSVAIDRVS
jgi:hypothetical protein